MVPYTLYQQLFWLVLASLLLAGCAGQVTTSAEPEPAPTPTPTDAPASEGATSDAAADTAGSATEKPTVAAEAMLLPPEPPPPGAEAEFATDFSKHTVPYSEIRSGGPPKDGIPAIDAPRFVSVEAADSWLDPVEPVIQIDLPDLDDTARAYPIQILMWHEIVNDTIGGTPVTVTFCPLCNTAIAFAGRVERMEGMEGEGQALDFGTTGRLRFSNLVMYDRQTESWWQQASGEAIAGELAGAHLDFVAAEMVAWEDFKAAHPDGQVLSRETGFNRAYGNNPYAGYDDVHNPPFAYDGPPTPGELLPMERVLTVERQGEAVAYPYTVLQEAHVVNDTVGARAVVVLWEAGTASALDSRAIAEGRDVGAANAYERVLDGQVLTFAYEAGDTAEGGQMVDQETGSVWNARGEAVSGELAGQQLPPVVAVNHFWFSWAAFSPETRVYQP